MMKLILKILF